MEKVKAKKHLGQHFLKDESIAKAIADTLSLQGYDEVLEIGPGMGVLTKYLLDKPINTHVIEIDGESVVYLGENYPKLKDKIISQDFLKYNINEVYENKQFAIIGNFPLGFERGVDSSGKLQRDNTGSLVVPDEN